MSNLYFLLAVLACALPSAALLWLGAGLADKARSDSGESHVALRAIALGLATMALWWPLQQGLIARATETGSGAWLLLTAVLAMSALVLLAAATVGGSDDWVSARRLASGGATWLMASMCIIASSPDTDIEFASWAIRSGLGGLLLTLALIGLTWPLASSVWRPRLRIAATALGSLTLAIAPAAPAQGLNTASTAGLAPVMVLLLVGAAVTRLLQALPARAVRATRAPTENVKDALTGLLTRAAFERQLDVTVLNCDRDGTLMALMFVDLDGFKPVNDTFGHASGDRVLRKVGQRLRTVNAAPGDVVARVGGDEFLVLLAGNGSPAAAASRAREILQAVSRPYEVEGRQVAISCSIGIATYPDDCTPSRLVARADAAMYAAKRAGGAGFCFFAPSMEEDARDRFDMLRDLRLALERKELELFYQPKIDAATGKVTAAEALLRWLHPTRGMVPPAVFIPIAERFGLIRDIGQWVIDDACRQASVWADHGLRMRVAINLSAVQMRQEDIVARLEGALLRHHVDPSQLTCEITESVAMEDTRATQATFRELGAAGIHLSIDDFGSGYSSLAYLRKLPAEELKIDGSFITDVEHSADARAVVDAVVKLAHALGLKVVAEGVENGRQRAILTRMGCDELQGFLFAKPMTARALLLWAMDDRKEDAEHFASSLFVSTAQAQLEETAALH